MPRCFASAQASRKQRAVSRRSIDTIANQWHDGIRSWVEVGPKGTLSRMVKPILDAVPVEEEVAITAVGSLEGVNAFA